MKKLAFILYLLVTANIIGCTHSQLRYNHIKQAGTLTGIYERQVLNNLAMFRSNPESLPFFAVPEAGSADVTDSGALSAAPLNGPGHTALDLSSLGRDNKEGWTFKPISDPQKLTLMRCAYRRAIGLTNPNSGCVDCCGEMNKWEGKSDGDADTCCGCCRIRSLKMEAYKPRLFGKECEKVGSYCGTHIRVCQESYGDFTQLVLTILDFAVNSPTLPKGEPKSQVTHAHYLRDEHGNIQFDPAGHPIVDFIDSFTTKAHEFSSTDKNGDSHIFEPVHPNESSDSPSTLDNLLNESILQRKRATLLPQFAQ